MKKKEIKLKTSKGNLWLDFDAWKKQEEFIEKKEQEYWEYVFSGQRDLDLFGEEGVKRILAKQDKEDRKHQK